MKRTKCFLRNPDSPWKHKRVREEVFTHCLEIEARMQQAFGNFQIHSRVTVGSKVLRIQQRLGNGAFGVVYKVIDEKSSNVYALKDVVCV